jgi:SAM-dependent methyltransferase
MGSPLYKIRRFFVLLFSDTPLEKIYLHRRIQQVPIIGTIVKGCERLKAYIVQRSPADYARMQKRAYESYARLDAVTPGDIGDDFVVGSWREHDAWKDYEDYLMKHVPRDASWVALEYGCGPGRNIRRWTDWFKRIDGVDIAQQNLDNARIYIKDRITPEKSPRLFLTEGLDCGAAPHNSYDFAFSTICLQHICVHSVRYSIFTSLFNCLKPGGRLSIQMGFGVPSPSTVPYHAEHVQATETNRGCDVAISSPNEVKQDLERIGFISFEHWIRATGPGDCHPNWIFFTAVKPVAPEAGFAIRT